MLQRQHVALDEKQEPSTVGHSHGLGVCRIVFGITTQAVLLAWVFLLLVFCCSYSLLFDLKVKLLELKPGSFHKLNGEDGEAVASLLSCHKGGLPLEARFLSFSWSSYKLHQQLLCP